MDWSRRPVCLTLNCRVTPEGADFHEHGTCAPVSMLFRSKLFVLSQLWIQIHVSDLLTVEATECIQHAAGQAG